MTAARTELDGATWERYSVSVWDITKSRGEQAFGHPAMFPVELAERLIRIFTRKGELVLDPFAGSGTTLVAAKKTGRPSVGLEINPEFVGSAKQRLLLPFPEEAGDVPAELVCDDALNLLNHVKRGSVSLVVTSPPYWNVHTRKRTSDGKKPRPYSTLKRDLGNIEDYSEFMRSLGEVFTRVHEALSEKGHCVVVVMDLRYGSSFIPFHIDIYEMMRKIGFILEDIIIWDRRREYNNLRPLGYPYRFIVNKVHEYILIFGKGGQLAA